MTLVGRIPGIGEIVFALLRREGVKERSDPPSGCFLCPFGSFPEQVFELGEDLLNGVKVRAVGLHAKFPEQLGD